MDAHPFIIDVNLSILNDLKERLASTRWPDQSRYADWRDGTSHAFLQNLVSHWQQHYDWREQERTINKLAHFKTATNDGGIHYIHERGKGPNPFPLILTHGYPDSFYRFAKLIPMLTDPESFGGHAEDAFDVVVPDLPGFGFSDKPTEPGALFRVHELWAHLMTDTLGYARYGAHGGDWGSTITEMLARSHSNNVVAIHLTDIPYPDTFKKPDNLTPAETKFFEHGELLMRTEAAYAMIQATKPQSLSLGLNDSPVGLASWMVEKFYSWTDCNGDLETRFTKDELITHIMIYWVTGTIGSSFLPYYDFSHASALTWIAEMMKKWVGSSSVPAAFALFPKDISQPPRELAERFFNVQRWTEMPLGGHFAAAEEPELLAQDLREWFRGFRAPVANELANSATFSTPMLGV